MAQELVDGVFFPDAYEKAKKKLLENFSEKGNSWMTMDVNELALLLEDEWAELKAPHASLDELLDIINLAAMLHDRLTEDGK